MAAGFDGFVDEGAAQAASFVLPSEMRCKVQIPTSTTTFFNWRETNELSGRHQGAGDGENRGGTEERTNPAVAQAVGVPRSGIANEYQRSALQRNQRAAAYVGGN